MSFLALGSKHVRYNRSVGAIIQIKTEVRKNKLSLLLKSGTKTDQEINITRALYKALLWTPLSLKK